MKFIPIILLLAACGADEPIVPEGEADISAVGYASGIVDAGDTPCFSDGDPLTLDGIKRATIAPPMITFLDSSLTGLVDESGGVIITHQVQGGTVVFAGSPETDDGWSGEGLVAFDACSNNLIDVLIVIEEA